MREIKFRGKRVDNGEWVHGDFTRYSAKLSYIDQDLIKSDVYEVSTETVGQFTGLKDKNGVEIYEWDICNLCNKIGVIAWIDYYASYGLLEYKEGQIISDRYQLFRYYELEVIGNIHDNPELLQ